MGSIGRMRYSTSCSPFKIREHVLPCQHIRTYPRALAGKQEEELQLVVKQYTPRCNPDPKPGDVTIIGTHGNGFPKELYEPLWEKVLAHSKGAGFSIRNIWVADMAHQGASGILNEGKLGNDPSWFDHARDLNQMINHFRIDMIRPMVGIGHSIGGHSLVNLSLYHPRLLESLILIEPGIFPQANFQGGYIPAMLSARRRDSWNTRAEAAESFEKKEFYQRWDPCVFKRWVKYGLREQLNDPHKFGSDVRSAPVWNRSSAKDSTSSTGADTAVGQPSLAKAGPVTTTQNVLRAVQAFPIGVTLTTTKHQEVFTYIRPKFDPNSRFGRSSKLGGPNESGDRNWGIADAYPDSVFSNGLFYRPEPVMTFQMLPYLSPSVLYIFGENSDFFTPETRADILNVTGTGVGGSGGLINKRVEQAIVPGTSHLVPMEMVGETAEHSARWLYNRMHEWRECERVQGETWGPVPATQKRMLSPKFRTNLNNAI